MEAQTKSMLTSCTSDNRGLQKRVTISTGTLAKKVGSALLQATAFAMFLVACSTPETPPDQLPRQAMLDTDYRLSPDDLLDFRIYQEPDFDAVIRVSGDGTAIFPMIGKIDVADKTIGQATEILRKRYMEGFLANPQVNLTVRTYARKVFTILGQVQKPGTYQFEAGQPLTLLQAIGLAGGYTRIANPSNVTVKRSAGGAENVYHFNAKKMAKSPESYSTFRIMPGDVITVAESIF
jgi:protein involved in polysaccharide export with SLBB domain